MFFPSRPETSRGLAIGELSGKGSLEGGQEHALEASVMGATGHKSDFNDLRKRELPCGNVYGRLGCRTGKGYEMVPKCGSDTHRARAIECLV